MSCCVAPRRRLSLSRPQQIQVHQPQRSLLLNNCREVSAEQLLIQEEAPSLEPEWNL